MWDLWWKKWHWDRILYEFFGFPLSISSHRGSPYSYIVRAMMEAVRTSETSVYL
jgi:hypothetical protein